PVEATCHSSVGNLVAYALGNQAPQSGSSATLELIPMSRRLLVMIWFDATQSDQPEMTWMSSLTASPFGSISLPLLYVKPASVSVFLAAAGLYVAICLASFFTDGSVTQVGKSQLRPSASVAGAYPYSPSFVTVLRSIARLSALRNAAMLYGYSVVSSKSDTGYPFFA